MQTGRLSQEERSNLVDLQAKSITVIALFIGLIGYIWLVLGIWLQSGAVPFWVWAPPACLMVAAVVGIAWRNRWPGLAAGLILSVTVGVTGYAIYSYRMRDLAYLFVLGVTFASVLSGRMATLVVCIVAVAFVAASGPSRLGLPLLSFELGLPLAVIVLAAAASWLSSHNLYTALTWAWNGYDRAHRNEQIARQQQAELRQALKALGEATYRLERANQMLAIARDQAEEARRLKQQFAQTISHELRTPLNLIVGFTELMARSPDYYGIDLPPPFVRDLSTVHRNSKHLLALINDILDLARIEAAQMALLPEKVEPATLVREAVDTARSLIEVRGLALHTLIEPQLPMLMVDPLRIRQVLFNLLNNAARFTERGSVTVSVRREGDEVVFSVADTGVGISEEDLPRVFREFEQLDSSTRRQHSGAGLGLAISRQLIELHGGRIWVKSRLGHGSTFSFALPTDQPDVHSQRNYVLSSAATTGSAQWRKERILLMVTKSPSAAALLARYLKGYRVVTAADLDQLPRLAQNVLPQAILIDQTANNMAVVNVEGLAKDCGLPGVPFLVCPLPGEEPLRQRLDVDGYLIKPVTRSDLWGVLRRFGKGVDHILIVDDDPDFVRLMRRMLEDPVQRYHMTACYSGREALEKLRRRPPDLLLLDLILPDVSGVEVIAQMRSHSELSRIPVVVVSGEEDIDGQRMLHGSALFTKGEGLTSTEVIHWLQSVLDVDDTGWKGVET